MKATIPLELLLNARPAMVMVIGAFLICIWFRIWLQFGLVRMLIERFPADWEELMQIRFIPFSRNLERFVLLRQDADLNDGEVSTTVDLIWGVNIASVLAFLGIAFLSRG